MVALRIRLTLAHVRKQRQAFGHPGEGDRRNGVGGDAHPPEFIRQDDRHSGDASLGCTVVGLADVAEDPRR